ncbi:MAG: hypothetical protein V9F03_00620 [Microthrixaceae bacterium]
MGTDHATAEVISDASTGYTEARVSFPATLASARLSFTSTSTSATRSHPTPEIIAVLDGFGEIAQPKWFAWRNKKKLLNEAPENISELVAHLEAFADPVLDRRAAGRTWNSSGREWKWHRHSAGLKGATRRADPDARWGRRSPTPPRLSESQTRPGTTQSGHRDAFMSGDQPGSAPLLLIQTPNVTKPHPR